MGRVSCNGTPLEGLYLGTLVYSRYQEYEFDYRTLAHLRVVIAARLRRRESFFLVWTRRDAHGSSSISLWITPSVPLVFRFPEGEGERLSRRWIEQLMRSPSVNRDLVVMPEEGIAGRE